MSTIKNIEEVKVKMKNAWNAGDYGKFATFMEPGAVEILSGWNISPGEKLLDVVATIVGAMFAPQPDRVASELLRVCKPGGRILMVNWTPEGMVGHMFREIGKHAPPPKGVAPPVLWGDESAVRDRFFDGISSLRLTRKNYPLWTYPFGPAELVQFFFDYYGPTEKAYGSLDETGKESLRKGLEKVFSDHNTARNGTTNLRAEYLEVEAIKK